MRALVVDDSSTKRKVPKSILQSEVKRALREKANEYIMKPFIKHAFPNKLQIIGLVQ